MGNPEICFALLIGATARFKNWNCWREFTNSLLESWAFSNMIIKNQMVDLDSALL